MSDTLIKPKPTDIFKYTSFNIAEKIISDKGLHFSNPINFNDPFDCTLDNVYFDFSADLDPKIQVEVDQLKTQFKGVNIDNALLERIYKGVQSEKKDGVAATCFSLDPNNVLMWAHYAHKHTGVCLHFDDSIPDNMKFTDVKIDIQGHVEYRQQGRVNYCSSKIEAIRKIYLNKSYHWEYENEFRLITLNKEGIYHFNPKYLKTIIFGLKTAEADRKRIIDKCNLEFNHVKFMLAQKNGPDLKYLKL